MNKFTKVTVGLATFAMAFVFAGTASADHVVQVNVMKHVCNPDIQSVEDFNYVDVDDDGVTEFTDKVLACPTVLLEGDDYVDGAVSFDGNEDFDFEVTSEDLGYDESDLDDWQDNLDDAQADVDEAEEELDDNNEDEALELAETAWDAAQDVLSELGAADEDADFDFDDNEADDAVDAAQDAIDEAQDELDDADTLDGEEEMQSISDASLVNQQVCEAEMPEDEDDVEENTVYLGADVNGDGELNACLDTSYYAYEGVTNGEVSVEETESPTDMIGGALEFTPDVLGENNDADTLDDDDRFEDGVVELDTMEDDDGVVTLHLYNFQDEMDSDEDEVTDAELNALLEQARQALLSLLETLQAQDTTDYPDLPNTGDGSFGSPSAAVFN